MKKFNWRALAMCLATAVISMGLVIFGVYNYFGGSQGLAFITKMNTVRQLVDKRFVEEVDWDSAADGAASGVISALGDRWSYYMTAEDYAYYLERSQNSTTGIGVTVTLDAEGRGVLVMEVVEDSPAMRAGIKAGDVIIAVDGESVAGKDINAVSALIRGQTAEYSIRLLDGSVERSVSITNGYVYTSPVSFEMASDSVGYIRIKNFEKGAADESKSAIESLLTQGAESLVFDVRSNPGGQLSELIDILDYLLPEGDIFVSLGADGSEEVFTSDADCLDMPMAVLIDANSYSAAEFFAAALREYDMARLFGQASTGKARSQQTFTLSDGSAVHISTKSYLTPNRVNLAEEGGLVPDVEVAADGGIDAALEEAVKYLS